jgi:hypothetical protein
MRHYTFIVLGQSRTFTRRDLAGLGFECIKIRGPVPTKSESVYFIQECSRNCCTFRWGRFHELLDIATFSGVECSRSCWTSESRMCCRAFGG